MERTVVILQPGYLPWLGFFEQLYQSETFVFYDDVQYDKNGWRNRNRIKTQQGIQWLTVPVTVKNQPLIKDVEIDNRINWQRKHLEALRQSYSRTPFFNTYFPLLAPIYERSWRWLLDLDVELIRLMSQLLGLERQFCFASELGIEGQSTGRLVAICQALGATRFYEGAAGQNYIDESLFSAHQIQLVYQHYQHPTYQQLHGEFIPYLSTIDLLFNHGAASLAILTRTG